MEFIVKTDSEEKLRVIPAENKIGGSFASAVSFIEKEQLLDKSFWVKFVEQYREKPDGERRAWRGEYWGKMMRGAVSVYAYTKSEELYSTLEETIRDMLTVADEDGRVSTYSRETEFRGWDMWCRKYVLLGMLYFYDICKSEELKAEIIDFSVKHTDYVMERVCRGKLEITQATSCFAGINSSSFLEPAVWLYRVSGEKRFLDYASYIVECGGAEGVNVFEMAYENKLLPYQYGISKAYELISCFEGLLAYYEVTGIEKYKTAAINFGNALLESDVSIIGSLGVTHELLDHTAWSQTSQRGEREQETCVTVTWMKYCASLYRLTGDTKFADAIEKSFYNAYLGAINTEHCESEYMRMKFSGQPILNKLKSCFMPFDSYSPLTPGKRGIAVGGNQVLSDGSYYGCCACIGAIGLGIYAAHRILQLDTGIVLSFLDDGEWESEISGKRVFVSVSGAYPVGRAVKIKIRCEEPLKFDFKVRIPAWSENTAISSDKSYIIEDGCASFDGEWSGESVIDISFDMKLREIYPITWDEDLVYTDMIANNGYYALRPKTVYHKPEHDDYIALERGPIVLSADSSLGKPADSPFSFERESGKIICKESSASGATLALNFKSESGEEFTLIDYASAGKDWKTLIAAWLPTK